MTEDQNQARDLPTAGRRPPHAENPDPGTGDAAPESNSPSAEANRVQSTPSRDEATVPTTRPPFTAPDDEVTAPLARPPAPAPADDRPPAPAPADDRPSAPAPADDRPAGGEPATSPESGRDLDGPTRRIPMSLEPVTVETEAPAPSATGPGAEPVPEAVDPAVPEEEAQAEAAPEAPAAAKAAAPRRLTSAGTLILVLLALFGFTLVVQLRSNDGDQGLATMRQEDLVRILSDLDASDSRLQSQISALETSQRQLSSGVAGRQAALAEAEKRADELGLLAGTLPGRGPGLVITMDKVKASAILNAVQELRGAGGEVLQLGGSNGQSVRIVASSYFVDAEGGGIIADNARLSAPYTLSVIGSPQTMQTALQIPGGVVASVNSNGGSVTMEQQAEVEVTAVRQAKTLQYARPAS
ncbi:DUF881 domain-containing protein [Paractinoplanes toevensis]|uniref:DUF881 domain-containing protein n=1 Tax=Paractinoplanes toevensis TaxID=571911 RepID=A0A919W8N0_9ACTN|nr:DUF881 domain-containing protein [Actinoplanes toevensis]GIM94716.1 hypothetical protein Ato02nite_065090 [Actinoplanes toevensis]